MHRCMSLTAAGRVALRAAAAPMRTQHTLLQTRRALHLHSSALLSDASAASSSDAAASSLPSAVSALDAGAALLAGESKAAPRRLPKKLRRARQPKLVSPLLGRIWRGAGTTGRIGGTVSPDDWSNIVTLNRQRLLQLKEKEQFAAYKSFQRMKAARMAFLEERGEKASPEMMARIADREAKIMQISAEARAALKAPIPPMKVSRSKALKSDRSMADSVRALSHPQTYLKTVYPTAAYRLFSFRLTHYHSHLLHKQMEKFREMAKKLGLSPSYPTYLPHKTKRFTIIRSPHVDKTSREQFETRLYSLKIHFSPSPEKFYAIQRLSELGFRLINGAVRSRIETPPNVAIETFAFAPNPTKPSPGYTPPQIYSERDSPGIENILYKFDQHQFPFLMDWQEEILDERFRGIYPEGRDPNRPFPMRADELVGERTNDADEDAFATEESEEELLFDEQGEFQLEDDLVGEDDSVDYDYNEDVPSEAEESGAPFELEEEAEMHRVVPRKRRY